MLSRLTECSILMLGIILDLYQAQKITREELLQLSETKVKFLTSNIDNIESEKERMHAVELLEQLKAFSSHDVRHCSARMQYSAPQAVNQDHLVQL